MYKLTYETPQGIFETTFEERPNTVQLLNSVMHLHSKARLPALLKPPVKTEAA